MMERPFGCTCSLHFPRGLLTQHPDLFNGDQSEPAPSPTAPAAGAPLLNQLETEFNHQFFDDFGNESFLNEALVSLESFDSNQPEAIANIHGVFSSLAQPGSGSHAPPLPAQYLMGSEINGSSPHGDPQGSYSFSSGNCPAKGTRSAPSLDALGHNGLPSRLQPTNFAPQNGTAGLNFTPQRDHPHRRLARGFHGNQIASNTASGFYPDSSPADTCVQGHGLYGAPAGVSRSGLTFGSDASFQAQYYAPPSSSEDMQAVEGRMMGVLAGLEAQPSAANTQPSSPVLNKPKRRYAAVDSSAAPIDGDHPGKGVQSAQKRQRLAKDDAHAGTSVASMPSDPPRRPKKDRRKASLGSPPDESISGVPDSRGNDTKPPRQNLTEEEKKLNHIKSEQKRRNQIKAGFADLIQLLPETTSAGPSKCVVLAQAVEWLSDLIEGNKRLQAQLDSLHSDAPCSW